MEESSWGGAYPSWRVGPQEEEYEEEDIIQMIKVTQLQRTGHLREWVIMKHRRIMD
jgi:hypothetical protein